MGGAIRLWLLVLAVLIGAARAEAACTAETYEGNDYTVCRFDLRQDHLQLFNLDDKGEPYGSFAALSMALQDKGQNLAFGMNAGMYGEDLKPIGLYIEDGKTLRKLNRRNGPGNFHMKPNGVFYHRRRQGRRDGDGSLRGRGAASTIRQPVRPDAGGGR